MPSLPNIARQRCLALLLFVWAGIGGRVAVADDWPQWRGPRRDAVSDESGLLDSWPTGGPSAAWRASGLGTGYSSVVVQKGRLFTVGRVESDLFATALDAATGRVRWSRKIGTTERIPCSTPTADQERLYVLDPDGELLCLESDSGQVVWQRHLVDDFGGRMMSGRGYGESPLVDGERLIVTPGGPEAALVALDKRTGETVWKGTVPPLGEAGREGAGFASIVTTRAAGVRQYVQLIGRGVVGLDAQDGRFLWGYNPIANNTANIPTPVVQDDLVFVANGYNAGSVLLRIVPDESQTVTAGMKVEVQYTLNGSQFQNHHGGVVLRGNQIFGGHGSNNGLPTLLELATGQVHWKRRGPGVGSTSVVYADGRYYCRYQNGVMALLEVSASGYTTRGTLEIPGAGGDSWAHPVVSNGVLYLREQDHLWAYDVRRREARRDPPPSDIAELDSSAPLLELKKWGVTVRSLSQTRRGGLERTDGRGDSSKIKDPQDSSRERPLDRYAFEAELSDVAAKEAPVIVGLAAVELTAEGSLPEAVWGLLEELQRPFLLDAAGTKFSDVGVARCGELKGLVGLDLGFCDQLTDGGLAPLAKAADLRVLILTGTRVSENGLRHLAPIRTLAALDLEVCEGITDAACDLLAQMRQLQALVLKKTGFERARITDAGVQRLTTLADLEHLNLSGNSITNQGLAHLGAMHRLRNLDLSLTAISDQGLESLRSLTELDELDLLYSEGFAGPLVTDAGLESLAALTGLTRLNLTGGGITDAGLSRLHALKHLAMVQLVHTRVTEEGIRRLQAALPGCRVLREPSPDQPPN
ncbi:MAG: PQQ-binding-like beta-propeller repeat protein [Planctomycetales bacterium]